MANLVLTGKNNSFTWQITGLGSAFNSTNYVEAGITKYQFTEEATSVGGTVSRVSATAGRTEMFTPVVTVSSYAPGTYTFWAWCKVPNGKYYPAGSATVTVTSTSSARPSNWSWLNDITSGGAINLTASEWVSFCNRVNDFRRYKGLANYSFTVPVSGVTKISAAICNEARTAIDAIAGHGTLPSQAVAGQPLAASFFLGLRNALNAIT